MTATVEPESSVEPESPVEPAEEEAVAEELVAASRSKAPFVVLALAVVIAGLGGWFTYESSALRSAPSAVNSALVDTGTTADVTSSVANSLNRIFSYSFDKTEVTEKAAAEVLRGPALDTYNQLFAQVRTLAPQQKLVLSTRVISSAVQSLEGGNARLLVFLDQSATRADNSSASAAASQLSVTAERHDGVWLITGLTPR